MTADRDSEIDRRLREAGAAWRADQPTGREPEPSWFHDPTRPSDFRSAIGVVAALVIVGVVVASVAFTLPRRQDSAGVATGAASPQVTPTASGSPQSSPTAGAPTSPPTFATVLDGDAVTAVGRLLESSTGAVTLCRKTFGMGTAGEGTSMIGCDDYSVVEVAGLDVHSLPGRQELNYWVSTYVRVNGTWSDGTIIGSTADAIEPPQGPGRRTVPCPTPAAGWPGNAPSAEFEVAVPRLEATIAESAETYSGLSVASIGDTEETALVVGTVADIDAVRDQLSATFPYNLCVIAVEFSAAELHRVDQELRSASGPWRSSVDLRTDRVTVVTTVLDPATVEALSPFADAITVEVAVEPLVRADTPPTHDPMEEGCGPSAPDLGPRTGDPGNPFGASIPHPIRETGRAVSEDQAAQAFESFIEPKRLPDGLALQAILLPEVESEVVRLYYAEKPLDEQVALEDWLASRVGVVEERAARGGTADVAMETMQGRGTLVRVGSYDAAIVLSTPISSGVKTTNLYWSDGTRDWTIIANLEPSETLDLARSIYCDG